MGVKHSVELCSCHLCIQLEDLAHHQLIALFLTVLQERVDRDVSLRFQPLVVLPRQHSRNFDHRYHEVLHLVARQPRLYVGVEQTPKVVACESLRSMRAHEVPQHQQALRLKSESRLPRKDKVVKQILARDALLFRKIVNLDRQMLALSLKHVFADKPQIAVPLNFKLELVEVDVLQI